MNIIEIEIPPPPPQKKKKNSTLNIEKTLRN